jgi:hypothetical protein
VRPKQSLVGLDGWVPVAEKNLPYEMTLSVLLTADAAGRAEADQAARAVPADGPARQAAQRGRRHAAGVKWAAGAVPEPEPDSEEIAGLKIKLREAARQFGNLPTVEAWIAAKPRTAPVLRSQITRLNNAIDAMGEAGQTQLEAS